MASKTQPPRSDVSKGPYTTISNQLQARVCLKDDLTGQIEYIHSIHSYLFCFGRDTFPEVTDPYLIESVMIIFIKAIFT